MVSRAAQKQDVPLKMRGHKTVVMAGTELSTKGDNRFDMGKTFFAVINNKEMPTFEAVVHAFVRKGTTVWTDGRKLRPSPCECDSVVFG